MAKTESICSRAELLDLGQRCANAKSLRGTIRILDNFIATLPVNGARGSWHQCFTALRRGLKSAQPAFRVFTLKGNTKLPFASFSTLPIVTCPGFGDCANWCYSLTSWRNPGAYCRQLQNTILLAFCPDIVASAFLELQQGIELRLYVDGDFESSDRIRWWFRLLFGRLDLNVYGYSKSWGQFIEYSHEVGIWPENYVLNLSSGSKWDDNESYLEAMLALPITRGWFLAVEIDHTGLPKGFARYDSAEYHKRVREALRAKYGRKSASCGGSCGDCKSSNGKHWCGDKELVDLTIGIGIH